MRLAVASQLQTWWLHMTEFLVMEELWLANGFEIHFVSQEHGTVFLFWKHGLYSFGVTLEGQKKNLYQNFKIDNVKGFATLGYLTH